MATDRPIYAGYVRVSKVGARDTDDLRSPEIQRRAIAALADREGFDVEWLNAQLNVSGAKADRETIMDAVDRVERGELAGIAVYKLDRLSRLAPRQRIELFERIEGERGEKPGRVKSASEEHDPTTPRGRFARDMFLSLARLQWEEAQEGFANAVETAISNGCHAHAPVGFRKPTRDDGIIAKGQPLVSVAAEAEFVRGVMERRARAMSWAEIARWADSNGIPPRRGTRWTRRAIETIVRNRAYLGEARYGDHLNVNAHEAIVSVDLFEAANAVRGVRPPRGNAALLSGLVRCAGCRHRMSAAVVGARKQLVYRCKGHHGSGSCPTPASVSRPLLDAHIERLFIERYGDVEVEGHSGEQLAQAARDVAEAEAEFAIYRDDLRGRKAAESLGGNAWTDGLEKRSEAVLQARAALRRARAGASGLDLGPDGIAAWPELPIGERRRLFNAGLDCVFVRRVVNGRHGALDDRIRTFWRGEAPNGLPGPGVRVALAPLDRS